MVDRNYCLIYFLINPEAFRPDRIAQLLANYQSQALFVFVVISLIRGLFLIPSTPFVLAGAILFPEELWFVFTISMIGVVIGSTAVYFFADFLGFSKKLEAKYPKKIEVWHQRLNSPFSALIVIAWSFFPLVPTDVICYVAGIVKMPYRLLIAGVIIGEAVLIYLYVFYGGGLFELILK